MPIKTKNHEFSDEEIMAEYKKRTNEYRKWRLQKAAEFLQHKKRNKYYHCVIWDDDATDYEYYLPLPDKMVARVRAMKEEIANNPKLDADDREDEYRDRIAEIGQDYEVGATLWPAEGVFHDIDIDNYIYLYRFDIHIFGENKNGKRLPATSNLTDEEYVELLAHLIDQPHCSFHHLAYLSPKLKAIHKKVDEDLHNLDFGMGDYLCHDHDYAVLMTELREDANKLLKQLKKNNDEYPYLNFLKDPIVNISRVTMEQHAKKNGK